MGRSLAGAALVLMHVHHAMIDHPLLPDDAPASTPCQPKPRANNVYGPGQFPEKLGEPARRGGGGAERGACGDRDSAGVALTAD